MIRILDRTLQELPEVQKSQDMMLKKLPAPGKFEICGGEDQGCLAVTEVLSCTALALYHPEKKVRAMVHYNSLAGPHAQAIGDLLQEMQDRHGAPPESLSVSLCYNSASQVHTHAKLLEILEKVFSANHPYDLCSFQGSAFYQTVEGKLFGGDRKEVAQRKTFLGARRPAAPPGEGTST